MEGGVHKVDKSEIKECLHLSFTRPYILQLALSAGLGGLLFGYDTGVISGDLLYIRDDFESVENNTSLKEAIVSTAVAGAIIGAAFGGWINDRWGRKWSILIADILFLIGAIIMALAPKPYVIIIGRVGVGLGVGMASMTSPLYISETSPAKIRGALVSLNGVLITGGQFIAYLINLAFVNVPGTWRWMLGIAAVPALLQLVLMFFLPESPRWLYRKGRKSEAVVILKKIYAAEEVEHEILALKLSIEAEIEEEGSIDEGNIFSKVNNAWSSAIVRRGLVAGMGVQIAQQFVGINTVMYYAPTIVQLAGYASNSTAMALSLITSGLNVIGTLISLSTVDKFGRRKLMLISMVGIVVCLYGLFCVFYGAAHSSPHVDGLETAHFGNSTCSAYSTAGDAAKWSCASCLEYKECGYCAHPGDTMKPGACLASSSNTKGLCKGEKRQCVSALCHEQYTKKKHAQRDKLGRRPSILFADSIFFTAAIFTSLSHSSYCIFSSRIFVGFAVGMASLTSSLYILEASPARIRGALVSLNALLVAFGQFVAYLTNLAFTEVPGTWHWMLGVACFPALIPFVLMLYLPESPRWLYRKRVSKRRRPRFWRDYIQLRKSNMN